MKQNDTQEKKIVSYEVTYGPKEHKDREKKTFSEEAEALKFFDKKDQEGFNVDAYEIVTVKTKKKLSK